MAGGNRTRRNVKLDALFFDALARYGVVLYACQMSTYAHRSVYEWRDQDPEFKRRWEECLEISTQRLEVAMMQRAIEGVDNYVTNTKGAVYMDREVLDPVTGEMIVKKMPLIEKKYSDNLAMFMAKARRPRVYRERLDLNVGPQPDQTPDELPDSELEQIIKNQTE